MRSLTIALRDEVYATVAYRADTEGLDPAEWLASYINNSALAEQGAVRTVESGQATPSAPPAQPALDTTPDTVRSRMARVPAALVAEMERNPLLLEIVLFPYQPGEAGAEQEYPRAAEIVDIAGAWDGLHYLLSAERRAVDVPSAGDDLFSLTIYGGVFSPSAPTLGYGPPGYLPPEAVRTISATLCSVVRDDLRDAYQPAAMDARGVYPLGWARDGQRGLEYLVYYFEVLRDFYARAALAGDAIMICLW